MRATSPGLIVESVTIPLTNLPPGLEGFTIVQLSDIHLLPLTKPELIRRAEDMTNGLSPDLIMLTGVYVWRELEAIYELTHLLVDLWTDVNGICSALDELLLPLLINQGVPLTTNGATLYLAGLDDGWNCSPGGCTE